MTSALRWAAMRAILMFSVGSDGQSHKTVSTNHNLFEEKGEPKRYRTEVLPLTSLTRLTARPNRLKSLLLWTLIKMFTVYNSQAVIE